MGQSHASNIPTIAYRPLKSGFEFKFPNSLSDNVFDEKNLIKKSKILLKKDGIKRKQDKNFNDYFCNLKMN